MPPERWWEHVEGVLARACTAAGLAEKTAALVARRARHCYLDARNWALYDDAVPTLGRLREQGWRHVIVSNHVPELPALAEALGLGPLVEHVVTSATAGYEKPHPEIYRIALGLAENPREAWMVGDNVVADVLGAERAGIRGILVRQDDARARRRCADLRGVVAFLEAGDVEVGLESAHGQQPGP